MDLLKNASEALKNAYAPYSHFSVGCAVLGESGKIYQGCNVENASFGATICAERVAISQAVASGEKKIKKVALINSSAAPCMPCGICLQVMAEFCENVEIVTSSSNQKNVRSYKLRELLPHCFDSSQIK